eukprot:TRINITY_DN75953_c0_g1_i1.p1 TRINITY_DN75953_c0_g1~~TRINITY_DN75953_c0_g1_i1.p1  ORF type:complete len:358 (-),score=116.30 TRINITY_DN75953_c0_g1_i1:191-1264(-)
MAEDISRSGRVRKKSTKLADFQSPDELELKPIKRSSNSSRREGGPLSPHSGSDGGGGHSSFSQSKAHHIDDLPPAQLLASEDDPSHSSHSYFNHGLDLKIEDGLDMDIDMKEEDFDDIPDIDVDDDIDVEEEDDNETENFVETFKTEIIKKPPDLPQPEPKKKRRDKGKSRFTAYMLWAKHIRASLLVSQPDMDFARISKRLGELWSAVPSTEKYNWKRRAKRLANRGPTAKGLLGSTKSTVLITKSRLSAPPAVVQSVTKARSSTDTSYRVTGTQPIDVAAHLTLLGESLSIIGERLTEHEGQIAVSGSLSVLLDSLLCAMGPLLCLTQRVPQLNGANPATLNQILDNVAYIMPGL